MITPSHTDECGFVPKRIICGYCRGGGNFFTHGDERRLQCSEIVEQRVVNGVRVMALCACRQKRPNADNAAGAHTKPFNCYKLRSKNR